MFVIISLFVVFSLGCARTEPQPEEFVTLEPTQISKITQNALQCIGETGVDPAVLVQIRNKKYSNDETTKKFFFCSFRKTGISTKKGLVKVDKMLDIYPEKTNKTVLRNVIEECNKEVGADPSDKIYNFFKCFQEKTPIHVTLMK